MSATAVNHDTTYLQHVNDSDSHEMIPLEFWGDTFDEQIAHELASAEIGFFTNRGDNSSSRPDITGDDAPITDETVWQAKGPTAPGAIDFNRRAEVMDLMGIERQLVFPGFGLFGYKLALDPNVHEYMMFDPARIADPVGLGRRMIAAHNGWAANVTTTSSGRIRPVGMILPDSVDVMVRDAERLIGLGCRAILLPTGVPPAGTSPADKALDPFWQTLAEANVPLTLHIGSEDMLFSSNAWSANVPEFVPSLESSLEFPLHPYRAVTMHYSAELWVTALVLGGVFERHPTLRFGVVELAAGWIGPLAERMDLMLTMFARRLRALQRKPSEYLASNVRVTPFFYENVDRILTLHPEMEDVLVYGSDYPHVEGGKDSKLHFDAQLAGRPLEVREKFFVGNGRLLLPD